MTLESQLPETAPEIGALIIENPYEAPEQAAVEADPRPKGSFIKFFLLLLCVWSVATFFFTTWLSCSSVPEKDAPLAWVDLGLGVLFMGVSGSFILFPLPALFARKMAVRLMTTGKLTRSRDERPFFSWEYLGRGMILQALHAFFTMATPLPALGVVFAPVVVYASIFMADNPPDKTWAFNAIITVWALVLVGVGVCLVAILWLISLSSRLVTATFFLNERATTWEAWRWARSRMKGYNVGILFLEYIFRAVVVITFFMFRGAPSVPAAFLGALYAALLALRTTAYVAATKAEDLSDGADAPMISGDTK
ncbi:MAG: hypothetical protein HUK22_08910 [Thermoguttaceae bacterium]|nr:hypothetical protein [Thermoguttaceae bacterium]